MSGKGKGSRTAGVVGLIGVCALSALALAMPHANTPSRVLSVGHELLVPAEATVAKVTLPDGHSIEFRGEDGAILLGDGPTRKPTFSGRRRRLSDNATVPNGRVRAGFRAIGCPACTG